MSSQSMGALIVVLFALSMVVFAIEGGTASDSNGIWQRLERCRLIPGERIEILGGLPFIAVAYDDPRTEYAADVFLIYWIFDRKLALVVFIEGGYFYVYNVASRETLRLQRVLSVTPEQPPNNRRGQGVLL